MSTHPDTETTENVVTLPPLGAEAAAPVKAKAPRAPKANAQKASAKEKPIAKKASAKEKPIAKKALAKEKPIAKKASAKEKPVKKTNKALKQAATPRKAAAAKTGEKKRTKGLPGTKAQTQVPVAVFKLIQKTAKEQTTKDERVTPADLVRKAIFKMFNVRADGTFG